MKKINRLSKENSPYLLQHAENPVDWFPWGMEAFEKAKEEDKPIFLSIGYSTCHWCHVMEKESFENEEIAELMNDVFVSIKVDREERPDIDGIYMSVCQMLTGSGGWPLTIIMTPDKNPFFAGTYFPRESRFGRPGMRDLIPQIKEIWKNKRDEINKSAQEIVKALNQSSDTSAGLIDQNIFEKAFKEFEGRYDAEYGGFGNAPKFPSPHNLNFLLRYYKRFKNAEALKMVETTLQEMRKRGIYDHIGFGFHRYSTDREWLVPHFEKMLYDQALLTIVYTEAYQVTHNYVYRQTAEEILEYVLRDMTSPEGGFYSAEDADSEGEEGKFYLWSKEEIDNILNEDADLIADIYNLKDKGNMPVGNSGLNILYMVKAIKEIADEKNMTPGVLIEKINTSGRKLFEVRKKRVHPYKDDKILTDWNALMISAFAKASKVFRIRRYEEAAVNAANFILSALRDRNKRLLHRYRNGEAGIRANIDDYTFTIAAFIDLYEATFDSRWLKNAIELNKHLITHFWDEENGGFYVSPDYGEELIARLKEIYDGAIPSGNSVAVLNLLRLGRITGDASLEEKAIKTTAFFSGQINRMPTAFSGTLTGLEFGSGNSIEVIIVGRKYENSTKEIIDFFGGKFLPDKIILLKEPDNDSLEEIASFIGQYNQINEKTTIYICHNYACEKPVTSLDGVKNLIN